MKLDSIVESTPGQVQDLLSRLSMARGAVAGRIVGQEGVLDEVLVGILADGHVLLEGSPGLGKTLLVKSLAEVLGLQFSRIQFTPDLMPADITGTVVLSYDETGRPRTAFQPGPIFAELVLADEINRATPKTQSALLEAMQERTATVAGKTHLLPRPCLVLATQNPIEMDGTYDLPEAQIDRFLLKVVVPFPTRAILDEILAAQDDYDTPLQAVMGSSDLLQLQALTRSVVVASHVRQAAVDIVMKSQTGGRAELARFLRHGVSPRGAQSLLKAARALALINGRMHVGFDDLKRVLGPALRHRLILNFEGQAQGISVEELVESTFEEVVAKSRR
ncbi:MAG TPA: AAA family ATPase [Trueperaceae bacterium]